MSLVNKATAELTVDVSGDLWFAVQWFSDSILVLSHDAEHILMPLHQVLDCPDPVFGLVGDGHPSLPVGHPPPDDVVCNFGATVVLWRQPGQCDPLSSDFLEFNGCRWRTRPACKNTEV